MKKIYLLTTACVIGLSVAIMPVKRAQAFCPTGDYIWCLLEFGVNITQDLGKQAENLFGGVRETMMSYLEEANTWLSQKFTQGMTGKTQAQMGQKTPMRVVKSPNFASKESGIASYQSYTYKVPATTGTVSGGIGGTSVTQANAPGAQIEAAAMAKQTELLHVQGTLDGMAEEQKRDNYISQREAIDTMARGLVIKGTLEDLKKLGEELDKIQESIVPNSIPKAENLSGGTAAAQPTAMKTRDWETSLRDNLQVRLMLDNLLTTQQQLLAMRLKAQTLTSIQELGDVSNPQSIKEIKEEDYQLPSATEDPQKFGPAEYDNKQGGI